MSRNRCFLLIFAVLLLPVRTWAGTLNIGDIHADPMDAIKRSTPLAKYLAKELQSEGIDEGKVVVVRSIPEMGKLLREGKIDLFIDSPFPALAVSRLADTKFLLRRWKKGLAEYRAVIFALKDGGVARLEDLNGKLIAFEEPTSTSTYFLPKLVMVQKGLKLVEKKGASDSVGPNEIGYVFVGSDPNTIFWVLRRRAAAGVANQQNFSLEARGHLDDLRRIHETFNIPRQIVSYRVDLNPKLLAKIKETLIKMDQSEEGRKALRESDNTTKFDELPEGSMTPLLKSVKFIESEFGIK
ncbi:MAG: phosphate/phosphite/phosphonate ABC transporter substrate-binding protein [Candidatus Binatia bacterium]